MRRIFRKSLLLAGTVSILLGAGCRSAHVQATVINSGSTALHNIEVDYPSASFGVSNLAPGAEIHHKIRLDDAGRMKVEFFDSDHKKYSGIGPYAKEGQNGTITITLDGTGKNVWATYLRPEAHAPKGE